MPKKAYDMTLLPKTYTFCDISISYILASRYFHEGAYASFISHLVGHAHNSKRERGEFNFRPGQLSVL